MSDKYQCIQILPSLWWNTLTVNCVLTIIYQESGVRDPGRGQLYRERGRQGRKRHIKELLYRNVSYAKSYRRTYKWKVWCSPTTSRITMHSDHFSNITSSEHLPLILPLPIWTFVRSSLLLHTRGS